MSSKRKAAAMAPSVEEPVDPSDELMFVCLGGGSEVGRSCHILQYKGKTVMVSWALHYETLFDLAYLSSPARCWSTRRIFGYGCPPFLRRLRLEYCRCALDQPVRTSHILLSFGISAKIAVAYVMDFFLIACHANGYREYTLSLCYLLPLHSCIQESIQTIITHQMHVLILQDNPPSTIVHS